MLSIDLRSDTVTRPSPGMRQAMAEAEVGDDVYGEDPTVAALEARVADLLGHAAALFMPSGTMANLVAVRTQTEPGDEVILEAGGHSYFYETGGLAGLCGVQAAPIPTPCGILDPGAVEAAIRPEDDYYPKSALIMAEQTSNRGGGTIYPVPVLDALVEVARRRGLKIHLDGARLWNAHVATGIPLARYAAKFDSVSVCLSKGLGAPVGSLLVGSRAFVGRAHRFRKMFGGGLRQAGVLAAAGLYAIEHQLADLARDHAQLRALTEGLAALPGLRVDAERFPTNIAYVDLDRQARPFVAALRERGVLVNVTGPAQIRVVTHRDLPSAAIDAALEVFRALTQKT